MKSRLRLGAVTVSALAVLLATQIQPARGGWSVNVDATGRGTVTVKVTSKCGTSNVVKTPFMLNPSAAINKQSNVVFSASGAVPACASSNTFVQVKASPGYVTSIQSKTSTGDLNDNDELLQYVLPKSACSSSDFDVVPLQVFSNAITFQYKARISDEGSAVLLRVLDALSGQQRYSVVLTGPLNNENDEETNGICQGTFTVRGEPSQFVVLVDGHTSTLPFDIECPPDQVLSCADALAPTYSAPAVVSGVTGPFTVAYDPPPAQLVPGVTNVVTVTATDTNGCTTQCQFQAYREPLEFEGFLQQLGGADATGGTCAAPLRSFQVGNVLPVLFRMKCGGDLVTSGDCTLRLERAQPDCDSLSLIIEDSFTSYGGFWQHNLATGTLLPGVYRISATLPDGSQHFVWIALSN